MALISKNENIHNSSVVLGYNLLKELEASKEGKLLVFEAAKAMKQNKKVSWRQFNFTLIFLYNCGIIDFEEPYIVKVK